jgi:hypothetical protein
MRARLYTLAWVFIILVAIYDSGFAWVHREQFLFWELNPFARWIASLFGLGVVLLLKSVAVAFGAGVAAYCHQRHHRLEGPYTLFVSGVHLALSLHYLIGQLVC